MDCDGDMFMKKMVAGLILGRSVSFAARRRGLSLRLWKRTGVGDERLTDIERRARSERIIERWKGYFSFFGCAPSRLMRHHAGLSRLRCLHRRCQSVTS